MYIAVTVKQSILEPQIELAKNYRLSRLRLKQIEQIIEEHYDELTIAWGKHFKNRSD
jgi:hypothetical protein